VLFRSIVSNLILFNWRHFFKRKLYYNSYKGICYFDSYWLGLGNKRINLKELYIKKSIKEGYICGFRPHYKDKLSLLTECFFGGYKNLEKLIPIILIEEDQKHFLKEFSCIEVNGILYKTFFEQETFKYLKLEVL
jgi:hypothetical protein